MPKTDTNSPLLHIPALDGLRGIAILLVVVYHDFHYLPATGFGWIGVDIFFVLSGFLITAVFLKNKEKANPILNFYLKRILRIFPLYYLSLVLLLLVIPAFVTIPGSDYYKTNQGWLWAFIQNWLYILKPVPSFQGSYLVHFWSLALEEQYYLIWPWILLSTGKPRTFLYLIIAALTVSFIARLAAWQWGGRDFPLFFFFNCTRIEGLCMGSLLAIGTHYSVPNLGTRFLKAALATAFYCFLLLMLKFYKLHDIPFFGFGGYLLIALATALVIHFFGKTGTNFLLNRPWLISIGKVSFGLYIIHWPTYIILSGPIEHLFFPGVPDPHPLSRIFTSIICLLLATGLSYLSYYGYEIFFLKLKKSL